MTESLSKDDRARVAEGLRMTNPPDPEKLAAERRMLASIEGAGIGRRTREFLRLIGPGYMQSAMTLGGGTASASLFAGALFGYQLLWVAPVAMILGVVMLAAVSHQTLSTGMRPFEAMRRYAGAPFAWGWALGALFSSIIWHFPQYSLASAVLVDMGDVVGIEGLRPGAMGLVILAWAVALSMMYGTTPAMVRWYERILKYMVWGIVLCFGLVVVKTGISDWGELAAGYVPFRIPGEKNGVAGLTIVVSGLAAAVGINMLFLYPYSLLARGWDREHRQLARFDLYVGMLLPYALATSLMVIAMANTINLGDGFTASNLTPVQAAQSLAAVVGDKWGRVVFDLGVLGMALSSITLQMLCTGFVCVELFGFKFGSLGYRLATLLPVPGVLGPVYWSKIAVWLAVPTNIVCGLFLPLAYVGFILLQRNRGYLGDDTPTGGKGRAWLGAMVFATLVITVFLAWTVYSRGPGYVQKLMELASEGVMRARVEVPGSRAIEIDDGLLDAPRAKVAKAGPAAPTRLAFAAAHVVMRDGYRDVAHTPESPGRPEEIAEWIDWEATRGVRRHLDAHGFGVAEAMDTAQRFSIGWANARRLIEECGALRLGNGFIAGAGVDHLDDVRSKTDLVDGVVRQVRIIQAAGGDVILLPLPWLPRNGASEADYVDVYSAIVAELDGPLAVHWLGEMFLSELAGYFPGESFTRIMALDPEKVRGAKLSLLDAELEVRLRRELAARDQIVLTGDDFHFARLILGGEASGSSDAVPEVRATTTFGEREVAAGDFSHALLGVLDGIAEPASVALQLLAHGDGAGYLELMAPCETLGRAVFEAPTAHYKAGLAFLAWLNGLQANAMLVNHEERGREREHFLRVTELAARAGALRDAGLAAERLRAWSRGPE